MAKKEKLEPHHLEKVSIDLGAGRDGEAILVDGDMKGESWPYLWIGRADGTLHAIIEWPALKRLARAIAQRSAK